MKRTLLLTAFLTACGAAAPPRVDLAASWPSSPPSYGDAHKRWTRRAAHSEDWTLIIDAAATLQSPEWRAAYARERTRRLRLGPQAEADLAAAQRAASEGGPIEIELVVATAKPEWNDFKKGKDSMWRLALSTADGREVEPLSVREDKRPRAEVAAWFPDAKPFYTPYVVTFPRAAADGRSLLDAKQVTLTIGGGLGTIELVWQAP
jgi:hypothetical protein